MILNYNFNVRRFIEQQLPPKWRQTRYIAMLYSWLKPVETLLGKFLLRNTDLDYRNKYSSQQKSLTILLNNLFDNTDRRIRVQTISDSNPNSFIYFNSEGEPAEYDYFYSEGEPAEYDYFYSESIAAGGIVYVPLALQSNEEQIKAWVRFYIFSGINFKIVYE